MAFQAAFGFVNVCVNTSTVGPFLIESTWSTKRVSTGELEALEDPYVVVQTKIRKNG